MIDRKLTVCYGRGNYQQAPPQIVLQGNGWSRPASPQATKSPWAARRGG